jgi:hypothetical protein
MRFSLKTSKQTYGPECDMELYFHQLSDVQINLSSQWYEPLGRIVYEVQDRIHREWSVCL